MAGAVRIRQRPSVSRQRPVTTCGVAEAENEVTEPTDLSLLKEVSQRLNLAIRRPSTVQWKKVIEFRKSMGLYLSDVEPEFLDKIVGAKMRDSSNNSLSTRPKNRRSRSKRNSEISENRQIKNDLVALGSSHQSKANPNVKKENPKHSESTEKSKPFSCTLSTEETYPVFEEPQSTDRCDVTPNSWEEEASERVGRFPLYDTEEEDDEVIIGMSEAAKRHRNITRALGKIRRDLIIMRMGDNSLARRLLDTRSEINIIKVHQSCDLHAEMLDDVTFEMEEEDLLPGLIKACDLPSRPPGSLLSAFSPLRGIGVSRMNINRRRFSVK